MSSNEKNIIYLEVKILPKSSKNEIVGWENKFLKIRIKEIAEKGKANKELIGFLSATLSIAKSNIKITKGQSSRIKKIEISNLAEIDLKKIQTLLTSDQKRIKGD